MYCPCTWRGSQGLPLTLTISRHSCSSYLLPLASTAVRILSGVRCSLMSCFMGLPFAGVLWNSQFKAAGSPTLFRGAALCAVIYPPRVTALGGFFLG
jgi:hypothetical protein